MKISINSLNRLNSHLKTVSESNELGLDELVQKINAQIGAVDAVKKSGDRYKGIVVAKVVDCQPHHDADKLKVCLIDDGKKVTDIKRDENGYIQVVCGAPNVAAGQTVAWLPPGAAVPESYDNDPFTLESREIRGIVSNGMLASPKELALGESHEGILVIDEDIKPGTDFAEYFGLQDDAIIEIENKMLTHRPDGFGYLGLAREIAGIQHLAFKSPEWYKTDIKIEPQENSLNLSFHNELPNEVKRFTLLPMSNVEVKDSPTWLQIELAKIGQKSINNIVDYTNYFMLLTGQPLHAYDYDKVKALSGDEAKIVIRNPKPGEKIKLLNAKEIEPRAEAIMIATDKKLIGVGGVMGGSETEVDDNTKNIILECGNFDMYSIRRTSMAHGLFTEAVTRFTKGQSPLQNLAVLSLIAQEIQNQAGGKIAGVLIDDNHLSESILLRNSVHPEVKITTPFINERLGLDLASEDVAKLLSNVEFDVQKSGDELVVKAPFWRTDIELREDIVEEIGRLHGYDNIAVKLPLKTTLPTKRNESFDLKQVIRQKLAKAGANELLTYTFVPGRLLAKVGQKSDAAFKVANALSPELEFYRLSLVPSLLDKVHPNIKAGYPNFAIFEIGLRHTIDEIDSEGVPKPFETSALVVAADAKSQPEFSAYYLAKKYLKQLISDDFSLEPAKESESPVFAPFELKRSAVIKKGGKVIGIIGEFKLSVINELKLPKYSAGFEVNTDELHHLIDNESVYRPLSKFPSVSQDITLAVEGHSFAKVKSSLKTAITEKIAQNNDVDITPIDIYRPDNAKSQNYTFRIKFTSHERTLTDKEITVLLDQVASRLDQEISAKRI